jgi:hypothetical protein
MTRIYLLSLSLALFAAGCGSDDNGTADTGGTGGDTGGTGSSTGGTGGTGGTNGGTPDMLASCPGTGLTSDGVLDVDLKAVHVTGHVTLKSGTLPDTTSGRGSLLFSETRSGASLSVSLGARGDFSYDVEITPGSYDIRFVPDGSACSGPLPALPCIGGTLKSKVPLTASGALDLDIPMVQVTGQVTLKGALMPSQTSGRGSLSFTAADGSFATTRSFGTSGAVTYNMPLLPGSYRVGYVTAGSCLNGAASALPCIGGALKSNVSLQSDGVLDVDIPAVQVTGQVTLKGAPLPNATGDRGALNFTSSDGGNTFTKSFGSSGAVSYSLTLLPGSYSVGYAALGNLCTGPVAPALPCNGGTLMSNVSLQSDGVLDVDIPAVQVTGKVTLKGGALPGATSDRGSLDFVLAKGGNAFTPNLGTSSAGSYAITLLPGSYSVNYVANSNLCSGFAPSAFPCNGGTVQSNVSLQSDGVLDVDIPAVQVTGKVTLKGAALPSATNNRGSLSFTASGANGSAITPSLGNSGAGSYAITLLPGSYSVGYVANGSLCQSSLPSAFPCNGGTLQSNVGLQSDGVLDVDIPAVQVTGKVTLNGASLPPATADRGGLQFLVPGKGGAETATFGTSGAGSYAITIIPGNYVVSYLANSQLCAAGAGALPCDNQLVAGCP